MGTLFGRKQIKLGISFSALIAIFLSFQNCQKIHFSSVLDSEFSENISVSGLFCSSENQVQIRIAKAIFDSQAVCTDSFNLNSALTPGKVCEQGPEIFAIPATTLEYQKCEDMTICGVKFDSKIKKNENYIFTFKNIPIGCVAQLSIYSDATKSEQLYTKQFNVSTPTCPVCNFTKTPTCGVCEDPIISACGYTQGSEFSSLSEITNPCLSGTLKDAPVFNSETQKMEWTCKGTGTDLSNCSYNVKPGSCEINFAIQNINYDNNVNFSTSFRGAVSEDSKQNLTVNCTDASGVNLTVTKDPTLVDQWNLTHLTENTTCTTSVTDILNNNYTCSNTVFVGAAPVQGVCGNQSNIDRIDDLISRTLCAVGSASVPTYANDGTQRISWICNGFNGGASASCFAGINPPVCSIILNPAAINIGDSVNYQFNLSGGYDSVVTKPYNFVCNAGAFSYSQSNKQVLGSFTVNSSADTANKLHCDLTVQGYFAGSSGTCSAEIDILPKLTITKSGTGFGVITGPGINCGIDCSESYAANGSTVTLTAIPAPGSIFAGWSSNCIASTVATCTITMNAAKTVSAIFNQVYTLSVVKSNTSTGSGTVIASTGDDCSISCSILYNSGTVITLTATAAPGSVFAGWNPGDCTTSTATTCTFTMTAAKNISTVFNQTYDLAVAKSGTGTGTVTATGINCGTDCAESYLSGTSVTLTVAPVSGSVFAGWNAGDCTTSTATTCTFIMTATKNISTVFNQTYTLTVAKSGTGAGSVTAVSGVDCGATCSSLYNSGTVVTLTASSTVGSVFAGWTAGDCTTSTATTCTFTMTATKNISAVFNQTYNFTVAKSGTGTGTVTATGVNCGTDCAESYLSGTLVTLTVAPASGSVFAGWNAGDCTTSTATTCTFTMTSAKNISTVFNQTYDLTVAKSGTGTGTVTATGINCGTDCSESYLSGTSVTLTVAPASGSVFAGWNAGDCTTSTATTCTFTMTATKNISTVFNQTYSLTVAKSGTGTGTVTATGINCGTDCAESYLSGTSVTLTVAPASGSVFAGWNAGDCTTSTATTCTFTMTATKNISTVFNQTYDLIVAKSGTGTGTVTATGINCGTDCAESYLSGTSVTLTVAPASGSVFAGWNAGDCTTSTATTCTFTMTATKNISTVFNQTYNLTVAKSGTGTGTVTATGINCGTDCAESHLSGTSVTLTVAPASGSVFAGWNVGDCTTSTATTCTFTMSATKNISTVFNQTYSLTVAKSGTGTGTVTATGINCGTDCSESYLSGTSVTLTVAPASGSVFAGWNAGDCTTSTATTCTFTMSATKNISTVFNQTYNLTVAKSGAGTGTVTAASGVDCGSTCSSSYNSGTIITLTATADAGSVFAGWTAGDCTTSTATTCTFTMSATKNISTVFNQTYTLTLAKTGAGSGTVTATGINCGTDCSEAYADGTSITLTVSPASGSAFAGWNAGDCTSSTATTCTLSITAVKTITTGFVISGKQVFTFANYNRTFVVPAGVTSILVKAWGAGGGGSNNVYGGGGGFVSQTLAVTPGESLTVITGQGGSSSASTSGWITYGGGGGVATVNTSSYGTKTAGMGGGRSAVQRASVELAVSFQFRAAGTVSFL